MVGVGFAPPPTGVLGLDTVGVVSVDPGIVDRRFDLGVMYGCEVGDAVGVELRTGTGIILHLF